MIRIYLQILCYLVCFIPELTGQKPAFISETFDKSSLTGNGWYDGTAFRRGSDPFRGSGCMEYEWIRGDQGVKGSSTWRHLFTPSEVVYVRFYLRLSDNWQWSGVNWHPHLIYILTTANKEYDGPAATHLTVYIEPVNGKLRLAAQDIQNEKMPHGLTQGPLKGGYNGLLYDSDEILFKDNNWHCIEALFKLNSIDPMNGTPNKDGVVTGCFDGKKVIDRNDVILRSPDFPDVKFNQFLIGPYFSPGLLDNNQKLWIDELTVSAGRESIYPAPSSVSPGSGLSFFTNSNWESDDREKRFKYGLCINSPWENGGTIFMHFPEHLEYNPVGNTILRHYDSIPAPWIISPDGLQAAYRVESPALKNVFIEAFARCLSADELPAGTFGAKLAMHIRNDGTETLPVIRALLCMQYNGLKGFPARSENNFEHNLIIIDGKLTKLSSLITSNPETTFKGCVVRDCPQKDTRSETSGGLITKDMDLALSVVTSLDEKRKVIIFWTPGKSMIANARIPCIHADPYFGTLKPGEEASAEGYLLFTEGDPDPVIDFLRSKDRRVF